MEHIRDVAFEDSPVPVESGQTISQPYIVAVMIEAACLKAGDRVHEIGAGSGYAAAVMGQVADGVFAIERHEELASLAKRRMESLGYDNVTILHGDGTKGLPASAPFDAIIAADSGPDVPKELTRQLATGGRRVMPVGEPPSIQRLVGVHPVGPGALEKKKPKR